MWTQAAAFQYNWRGSARSALVAVEQPEYTATCQLRSGDHPRCVYERLCAGFWAAPTFEPPRNRRISGEYVSWLVGRRVQFWRTDWPEYESRRSTVHVTVSRGRLFTSQWFSRTARHLHLGTLHPAGRLSLEESEGHMWQAGVWYIGREILLFTFSM